MSSREERELFLEYIKKIYLQNPDFDVTFDTIYGELRAFNVQNGVQTRIDRDNLIGIQARLSNNFAKKIKCFSNGYFFAIENRGQYVDDKTFYDKMNNSIKLYVSCDIKNLYNVTKSLFDYIIKENIITQSKIAKEMRNDVLVVRVSTPEEAIKIKNYVNSLKYKSTVKANPFILNAGNVSMTWDGGMFSYNGILCKLLKNYFDKKRKKRELINVSGEDFSKFIRREIFMCSQNPSYLLNEYQNGSDITNFVKVANILADNLDGVLTEDKLFEYQNINSNSLANDGILVDDRKDKLLYVIYKLSNYYDINYVHKILVHYVNTGEVKVFTRKDSIRNIIIVNFPPDVLKKEIVDMGRRTFYECIQLTLEKYNKDQCIYAIARFILNGELDGFTRNYEVRNKLGFLVPKEWFSLIIKNELGSENDRIIDKINMLSKEEKDIIIKKIGNVVMNGLVSDTGTFNDLTDDIIVLSLYVYNASIKKMEELQSKKIGRK